MNVDAHDLEQRLGNAGLTLVSDGVRAAAYEAMPVEHRGVIKFTLSLVEGVYGRQGGHSHAVLCPEYGIGHRVALIPAHWTLCCIGRGFASAPRLAAALMLARLSGQEHIVVVLHGKESDFPNEVLTVLELTGIDAVFTAPGELSDVVFAILRNACGPEGRILLFGESAEPVTAACPVWRDTPPRVALASANPDGEAIVRWAHPDATWSVSNDPGLTALYCAEASDSGNLRFGPGLEGCWLPPDLEAAFFMRKQHSVHICRELSAL